MYHTITESTADLPVPIIKIDSSPDDDFGTLYRVWRDSHFLGSYYQSVNNSWIIQFNTSDCQISQTKTEAEAQVLLTAIAGLLVADSTSADIDQLLDKPFDELTPSEWNRLKQL